ncbi:unnamed protein product [Withania somnifera]
MEARKRFMSIDPTKLPDPPRPSYTFTISDRDLFEKSKFENYDSLLKNRLARDQARANHLSSILKDGKAIGRNGTPTRREEVLEKTSTFSISGDYVATFTLGSEEIKNHLLIDTASDLVWWQCGPCKANWCYQQDDPFYVYNNSKTYRRIDCLVESTSCDILSPQYECSPYGNTCLYDYKYADGTRTRGWIADDDITFVLDKSRIPILFGCGRNQMSGRGQFYEEYSGIVGIGRREMVGGYSLPSQFKSYIMAMCLPLFESTKASTISFRRTPFKIVTSAGLVPNSKFPSFYYVNLYNVFINDEEIPFDSSYWKFRHDMSGGVLVDTGMPITRLPRIYYTLIRDTFIREVPQDILRYDGPLAANFDTCYTADPGQESYFPVVKMYFGTQNPNNLLLLAHHRILLPVSSGIYCLAFLPWDEPGAVIGNYQLQGIGLTFDTADNTLSF